MSGFISLMTGDVMEYIIRQAETKDENHIRNCAELAYTCYVPLIGRKPAPMTADYAEKIAKGIVYIAVDTQDIFKGFIIFYPVSAYILLENVAVMPDNAGRCIGKALIAFCENEARQCGLNSVRLYTNEKMTKNISFYHRLGYTEIGHGTEQGFNRIFFKKSLT